MTIPQDHQLPKSPPTTPSITAIVARDPNGVPIVAIMVGPGAIEIALKFTPQDARVFAQTMVIAADRADAALVIPNGAVIAEEPS